MKSESPTLAPAAVSTTYVGKSSKPLALTSGSKNCPERMRLMRLTCGNKKREKAA
jgi:hypothetical protein